MVDDRYLIWGNDEYKTHPLFGIQFGDRGTYQAIRFTMDCDPRILKFADDQIESPNVMDQMENGFYPTPRVGYIRYEIASSKSGTLREIEDALLHQWDYQKRCVIDEQNIGLTDSLRIQINRCSAYIARRTRRGKGNNVILSMYAARLLAEQYNLKTDSVLISAESNLFHLPDFDQLRLKFFVHSEFEPTHTIMVAYSGNNNLDSGCIVIKNPDGTYQREMPNEKWPKWNCYYEPIRFIARKT